MKKHKDNIEYRQDLRFRVNDQVLAVVNSAEQFHIIDISDHGLAFRYVGKSKWFGNPEEVDISYRNTICLKKFPVESVSDYTVGSDPLPMRRHSVKFGKLKSHQQAQLYQLILYYTKGKA